jgi:hypothetical protein
MRIYIAGPYTADHPRKVLENVNKAIDIGIMLMQKGHSVFIPHLSHYIHMRPNCPFEYKEYLKSDLEWLMVSEALFYIGQSPGADLELLAAKELGIKIFYSIAEVPSA